jgi:hypothetical protein
MASALLGEKQASAASRHGSQLVRGVLARAQPHRRAGGHTQAKDVLGVVRDP